MLDRLICVLACWGVVFAQVLALALTGALAHPHSSIAVVVVGVDALLVLLLAPSAYQVLCLAWWGATIGKRVAGIRVIRVADGHLPGVRAALLRQLWPFLTGLTLIGDLVVYLSAAGSSDPRQRGWHDTTAGTWVVRA